MTTGRVIQLEGTANAKDMRHRSVEPIGGQTRKQEAANEVAAENEQREEKRRDVEGRKRGGPRVTPVELYNLDPWREV